MPEPTENVTEAAVAEAPKEEPVPEQRQAEVAEDTETIAAEQVTFII